MLTNPLHQIWFMLYDYMTNSLSTKVCHKWREYINQKKNRIFSVWGAQIRGLKLFANTPLSARIRLFNLTLNRANNLSWQVRSPDNPLNEKKEKKKHPHTLVLNKYTTGYLCATTLIRIHAYFLGFLTLLRLFRCFCIEALASLRKYIKLVI